jgi:NADH:ubiquinone oxidoreductase subunit 6 (subunit J)
VPCAHNDIVRAAANQIAGLDMPVFIGIVAGGGALLIIIIVVVIVVIVKVERSSIPKSLSFLYIANDLFSLYLFVVVVVVVVFLLSRNEDRTVVDRYRRRRRTRFR